MCVCVCVCVCVSCYLSPVNSGDPDYPVWDARVSKIKKTFNLNSTVQNTKREIKISNFKEVFNSSFSTLIENHCVVTKMTREVETTYGMMSLVISIPCTIQWHTFWTDEVFFYFIYRHQGVISISAYAAYITTNTFTKMFYSNVTVQTRMNDISLTRMHMYLCMCVCI